MILFVAFSMLYVSFFAWALIYWRKIPDLTLSTATELSFSVIIPVRNEERNIQRLLADLENIDFPKSRYEVIFINDHSSDRTSEVLQHLHKMTSFSCQIIELADFFRSGKKEAISVGVDKARFDYILTTDADCSLPSGWLSAFAAGYAQSGAVMITGPVRMTGESFFQKMQAHEFAGLIGVGAASLKSGNPCMCNGANLSYRKEAFVEVNGYEGNLEIPTGDDEFLLQKLYHRYPDRITFLKNQMGVVSTLAKHSFKELINQRIRWSSKWRFHKSWFIKAMAVVTFLNYLAYVYGIIACIQAGSWTLFGIVMLVRWSIVYLFTFFVKRFLSVDATPFLSLILEIIYPFFVIFLGLASIFGRYSWKGRRYI